MLCSPSGSVSVGSVMLIFPSTIVVFIDFELLISKFPLLYITPPSVAVALFIVIFSSFSVYPFSTVINWYLLPPSSVMLFPFIVSFFVVCVVFAQFIVFVML